MSKFIKALDSIGVQPELTYKGDTRYKTVMGGIVSIILYMLLITGLIYFGSEIYERNNPTIITGYTYNSNPPRVNITPKVFPIAVGVQDPTNNLNYFKDTTIYKIKSYFSSQNRTKDENRDSKISSVRREIQLVDCNITTHGLEEESDVDAKSLYCIDPSEDIFLKGQFDNDEFYHLQFWLYQCNNKTANNTCKTKDVIDTKLKSSFLNIQYQYYFYNPKNYKSPMTKTRQSYYTSISNYGKKQVIMFLKKINYITDAGILTQDTDTQTYIQVDNTREVTYNIVPAIGENIASALVRLSFTEETNERSYMKIQTLLANIGGLYKILTLIATTIPQFFFSNYFYFNIINENFQVEEGEKKSYIHLKTILKSKFSNPESNLFAPHMSLQNNNASNVNLVLQKQKIRNPPDRDIRNMDMDHANRVILNKRHIYSKEVLEKHQDKYIKLKYGRRLSVSIQEYIKQFFCCFLIRKDRLYIREILLKGRDTIKQAMDMNTIVKKGFEIDKLKHTILNKEQRVIFDALPRANLETVNQKNNNVNTTKDILNLIEAYDSIKSTQTKKNVRLLDLLSKELSCYLEECINVSSNINK